MASMFQKGRTIGKQVVEELKKHRSPMAVTEEVNQMIEKTGRDPDFIEGMKSVVKPYLQDSREKTRRYLKDIGVY